MAVWYCGSVQYAAVPTWTNGHVYAAGAFVRQTAPTDANARVFRTTAGGTSGGSEPAWNVSKGATTTDNTVTWTEVTGNSLYGWSAAASRLRNLDSAAGWAANGDTIYIAKNHSYSVAASYAFSFGSRTIETQIISVDPGGSVPPVAADWQSGAAEATTGANGYTWDGCLYMSGVSLSSGASLGSANGTDGAVTFENCNFTLNNATAGSRLTLLPSSGGANGNKGIFRNMTVKFGAVGQGIPGGDYSFEWRGGSVDSSGSAPTNLFQATNAICSRVILDSVDLSFLGTNAIFATDGAPSQLQVINCKLGTGYTILSSTTSYGGHQADMIISDAGASNYKHERHWYEGDLLTETTNVRTGGANDGVTPFSWKMTTSSKSTYGHPFESFSGAIQNDNVGSARNIRFEIISSGTLKDNDVWVDIEYLGSSGSPQATIATSKSAPVGSGSAYSASGATWNTSGIGSPTPQFINITFTPQLKGLVRWRFNVAKASSIVWFDPQPALS